MGRAHRTTGEPLATVLAGRYLVSRLPARLREPWLVLIAPYVLAEVALRRMLRTDVPAPAPRPGLRTPPAAAPTARLATPRLATGARGRTWRRTLAGVALGVAVVLWCTVWLAAAVASLTDPLASTSAAAVGVRAESPAPPEVQPDPSEAVESYAPIPSVAPRLGVAPPALSTGRSPSFGTPRFGMSGHLMWHDVATALRQLDMLAHDHLGVVRFDVSWRGLEPSRGRYAFLGKLDQVVNATVARRIRPVITIDETPGWANGGQGAWVPPSDSADYARFAGMLARRYAGRVDDWEVWNEPDLPLFWRPAPDPAGYAALLKAASAAIRAANPSARVIGGSVTFGNVGYLRALYAEGVQGAFDALSVHPYTLTQAPGDEADRYHSLTAILDDMRAVMVGAGDADKPIWITELGWAVVGENSVSRAQRVAYLAQAVALIRARPFVQVVTMYTIDTADSARFGLSTNGVRSEAWRSYVHAVAAASQ